MKEESLLLLSDLQKLINQVVLIDYTIIILGGIIMAYEHLFSPVKIGNVEIPNRIALMPMGVFSPRLMNRDGSYTKDGADYYIERGRREVQD